MPMRYRTHTNEAGLTLVLALSILASACTPEASVAPAADVSFAKGGNSPSGGTGLTPLRLDSKALGCSSSGALAMNSSSTTVAGGYCVRSGQQMPFIWNGGVSSLAVSEPGTINVVSASGTAYGHRNSLPFFKAPGGAATYLPMPAGMSWGNVTAATDDDNLLFGNVEWQEGNSYIQKPVSWARAETGWTINDFPGVVADVTPSGGLVVGSSGGRAAYWTNVSGSWTSHLLPDDGALSAQAKAVNETGSVIVGVRWVPLPSDPAQRYDEHVAWISDGAGGWNLQVLGGLNILEGEAADVSNQLDGSTVAVGSSWDDTTGPGGQLWAVAWRKPAGGAHFGAPLRLTPLAKGSTAMANAVNSKGEVVGRAYSRSAAFAVMWRLQ